MVVCPVSDAKRTADPVPLTATISGTVGKRWGSMPTARAWYGYYQTALERQLRGPPCHPWRSVGGGPVLFVRQGPVALGGDAGLPQLA